MKNLIIEMEYNPSYIIKWHFKKLKLKKLKMYKNLIESNRSFE